MKRAALNAVLEAREAKRAAALVTDLGAGNQALVYADGKDGNEALGLDEAALNAVRQRIQDNKSGMIDLAGDGQIFAQVLNPPLRLYIVGAVHIAQVLAPMAGIAGYEVTVIDPRQAFVTDERFPGVTLLPEWPDTAMGAITLDTRTAVVTLTHDPKIDEPALIAALASPAFYIGALGSTRTHAKRVARLEEAGISAENIARIHAPVGLDIGSVLPAEIAVSILAQMTETLHRDRGT